MSAMASQISSLTIVYSTFDSGVDQRKHQSSASLASVWGIHLGRWIPRTKGQSRGKCFHLMTSSCDNRLFSLSKIHDNMVYSDQRLDCLISIGKVIFIYIYTIIITIITYQAQTKHLTITDLLVKILIYSLNIHRLNYCRHVFLRVVWCQVPSTPNSCSISIEIQIDILMLL